MTAQIIKVEKNKVKEPWEISSPIPIRKNLFYFSSTDFASFSDHGTILYNGKELEKKMAYVHPMVAAIVDPLFNNWEKQQKIWMVSGEANNGVMSVIGRVEMDNLKVLKRTEFSLSLEDGFKLAGAAIMKIHYDNNFLDWFLDSMGNRVCDGKAHQDMSRIHRKISEKFKENDTSKSYEYLAIANLAESKEGKEEEWVYRKKIATAFVYAVFASQSRDIKVNIEEICEKALACPTKNEETIKL